MSDLIDRQEVIDALCNNCDNPQAVCPHYPCKQYTSIEALPSANQWIPCSDRLPQHYFDVLITVKEKYEYEKEYRYHTDIAEHLEDDDWITFNDWDEGQEVIITAWMPLPEPWKGEEE